MNLKEFSKHCLESPHFYRDVAFGVAELSFRGRNACPVRGCVEASPCPTHQLLLCIPRVVVSRMCNDPAGGAQVRKFGAGEPRRKRHESDHGENSRREFSERACLLSSDSQFAIAHGEDLIAAAPSISRHPDSDVLVRWARNKSELLGKPAFDF